MFSSKTSPHSKSPNISIGSFGEDIADKWLIENKYKVLSRNSQNRLGEIDIVSRAADGTLVFVEVKTMQRKGSAESLVPEDNMTKAKLSKLRRACTLFVAHRPELVKEERGWRIDLLAIELRDPLARDVEIRHYENV